MPKIPVVKRGSIEKTMLGGYFVRHKCPHCKGDLKSKEKEVGKPDECPNCGGTFGVSKTFLEQIDEDKLRLNETEQEKKKAKQRAKQQRRETAERAQEQRRQRDEEARKRRKEKEHEKLRQQESSQSDQETVQPHDTNQSELDTRRKKRLGIATALVGIIVVATILPLANGTKPSVNPIQSIANIELQSALNRAVDDDERNKGIVASAYYRGFVGSSVIVFDLEEVAGTKSRLDVFRLLLDFAEELQKERYEWVELAFKGVTKFKLDGGYFHLLGEERDFQNPAYTIRTFPENLKTPLGSDAYPQWSGGLLGVMQKQMEGFNEFHNKWYMDDLTYSP